MEGKIIIRGGRGEVKTSLKTMTKKRRKFETIQRDSVDFSCVNIIIIIIKIIMTIIIKMNSLLRRQTGIQKYTIDKLITSMIGIQKLHILKNINHNHYQYYYSITIINITKEDKHPLTH